MPFLISVYQWISSKQNFKETINEECLAFLIESPISKLHTTSAYFDTVNIGLSSKKIELIED